MFDFAGNPVPERSNESRGYMSSDAGWPIGPGFVSLPEFEHNVDGKRCGEFGLTWSEAFVIDKPTDVTTDMPRIQAKVRKLALHRNSYHELKDAERHLKGRDRKGVVRSAASAVDAVLQYYCEQWQVRQPGKHLPFNEKIDQVLKSANLPPYSQVNAEGSKDLLRLYRSRSKQHEADCYYRDPDTNIETIVDLTIARRLLEAAKQFILWIDSQA
jgi:hypothetical protein